MKFGMYVSFTDHTQYFGTWGEPGVMYILDKVQTAGFDSVYWRMGSGQMMYPSKVGTPRFRFKDDSMIAQTIGGNYTPTVTRWYNRTHHSDFDCPKTAIEFGHEIGLKVYAWSEIDAEAHGWGNETDFYDEHPELRSTSRKGKAILGRVSWGREEALEYRKALMREHLSYKFDRIYLDFFKGGDHRIALYDEDGIRMDMYDECVVDAFYKKTGKDAFKIPNSDPEWVQFRADYVTRWLREVRKLQRLISPSMELNAFVSPSGSKLWCEDWDFNPPKGQGGYEGKKMVSFKDPLSGNYEDIATWTEEGLIDRVQYCLNPLCIGNVNFPDRKTLSKKMNELRKLMKKDIPISVKLYGYSKNEAKDIVRMAVDLQEEGVEEMVICESCPIERIPGGWQDYEKGIKEAKEKLKTF